jgi:hypothetical protein
LIDAIEFNDDFTGVGKNKPSGKTRFLSGEFP